MHDALRDNPRAFAFTPAAEGNCNLLKYQDVEGTVFLYKLAYGYLQLVQPVVYDTSLWKLYNTTLYELASTHNGVTRLRGAARCRVYGECQPP